MGTILWCLIWILSLMIPRSRSLSTFVPTESAIGSDLNELNPLDDPIVHKISHHDAEEGSASSQDGGTKAMEKKDAKHMVEIVVIAMLAMNVMFMIYCYFAEKVRARKRSKYHVVSGDEFHFDTVDLKDHKSHLAIEDIAYGQNVPSSNIDM